MNREIGPLHDGDDDPLAAESAIPGSLTRRRREAIHDALQLMGCNHPRNTNCDHVDAISALAAVVTEGTVSLLVEAIRRLRRPLRMPDIDELAQSIEVQTWISTSSERRR